MEGTKCRLGDLRPGEFFSSGEMLCMVVMMRTSSGRPDPYLNAKVFEEDKVLYIVVRQLVGRLGELFLGGEDSVVKRVEIP